MRRYEVINKFIKHNNFKSYLEIGVRNPDDNLNIINVEHKDGVDPAGNCNYPITSDEFFAQLDKDFKYDIIFIDGLHHDYQVIRDIENSINHLSDNGVIVCHDCLPFSEVMQRQEECDGEWTGDVWKAIAKFRIERTDLEINTVDTDYGLGIIRKGNNTPFKYNGEELTYDFYTSNRNELLNVITVDTFLKHYFPKQSSNNEYEDDIFIVDCWLDTPEKENTLIGLIERLRNFNIPILLCGHYPVKPEIQKLVDHYIYDGNNDILLEKDFEEYGVASDRWTSLNGVKVINKMGFHHDYAIWGTMRNAFNYAKYLGKKYIHFLEYDNLPDPIQYKQAFLEYSHRHDAVIYEYAEKSSVNKDFAEFCATFIFSIKTDVALELISKVNSKIEYFANRPNGWQLERVFLKYLKDVTNNIFTSKYIANDNELNVHAVWNRDHLDRNGGRFQIYLAVDNSNQLYIHFISGFTDKPADKDYLVEVNYGKHRKFYTVKKGQYHLEKIGYYEQNQRVLVYHKGVEVYNEQLSEDVNEFRRKNKIIHENKDQSKTKVNINFVDGPFVEILNDYDSNYHVQFINKATNKVEYELDLKSNHWAKCSIKYYVDWLIDVRGIDNNYKFQYSFNLENQRVLICFESKSLGDTLAFIPYVEKFRKERNCKVICSTFQNNLFKKQYKDIEFVEPGSTVNRLYALYRLGMFYKTENGVRTVNFEYHKTDPKTEPLTKYSSDILGLDYEELKPKLEKFKVEKKKLVTIGPHSTAQAKYWNNPTGWQDVTDYLISKGYEVRILSKEEDGYMGNHYPKGATKQPSGQLSEVMKVLQESELFIGISSGLSWVAWGCETPTIMISGFSDDYTEPTNGVVRIINKNVCNSCWNRHDFDAGDWNWCPDHKGTDRQFECSKSITSEQVINEIKTILNC